MNKDQPISRTGLEISITQTKIYKNRKKKLNETVRDII